MVAQNQVEAIATVQGVRANTQIVPARCAALIEGRNRQDPGRQLEIDAGIPVDMIRPTLSIYLVTARSAGQVVSRLAAADQVIAGTAVYGDALQ